MNKYGAPIAVAVLMASAGALGWFVGKNPDWIFSDILKDIGLLLGLAWLFALIGGFLVYATYCGVLIVMDEFKREPK